MTSSASKHNNKYTRLHNKYTRLIKHHEKIINNIRKIEIDGDVDRKKIKKYKDMFKKSNTKTNKKSNSPLENILQKAYEKHQIDAKFNAIRRFIDNLFFTIDRSGTQSGKIYLSELKLWIESIRIMTKYVKINARKKSLYNILEDKTREITVTDYIRKLDNFKRSTNYTKMSKKIKSQIIEMIDLDKRRRIIHENFYHSYVFLDFIDNYMEKANIKTTSRLQCPSKIEAISILYAKWRGYDIISNDIHTVCLEHIIEKSYDRYSKIAFNRMLKGLASNSKTIKDILSYTRSNLSEFERSIFDNLMNVFNEYFDVEELNQDAINYFLKKILHDKVTRISPLEDLRILLAHIPKRRPNGKTLRDKYGLIEFFPEYYVYKKVALVLHEYAIDNLPYWPRWRDVLWEIGQSGEYYIIDFLAYVDPQYVCDKIRKNKRILVKPHNYILPINNKGKCKLNDYIIYNAEDRLNAFMSEGLFLHSRY